MCVFADLTPEVEKLGGLNKFCEVRDFVELAHAPFLPSSWKKRWTPYIQCVCRTLFGARQRALQSESQLKHARRVIIVGGGPVGLMSALVAYRMGADAIVLEKRTVYNREIHFDLTNGAWGNGLQTLESWGLSALFDELDTLPKWVTHNLNQTVATEDVLLVACHKLQRFLAQTALLLGIDVSFGLKVMHKRGES